MLFNRIPSHFLATLELGASFYLRLIGRARAMEECLRQLLLRGWRYHGQTYDLYLRITNVRVSPAAMHGVVEEIRRLAAQERQGAEELRLRKAMVARQRPRG